MEQNRIILDLCGADAGVKTLADGARQVLAKHRELSLLLVGDAAAKPYATELADAFGARAEFLLAQDVIAQDASPERIVRGGEGSSMALALRALLQREDAIGLLSAGNTGALLVGTMFLLGLEKGLKVPALASAIPRPQGEIPFLWTAAQRFAPARGNTAPLRVWGRPMPNALTARLRGRAWGCSPSARKKQRARPQSRRHMQRWKRRRKMTDIAFAAWWRAMLCVRGRSMSSCATDMPAMCF